MRSRSFIKQHKKSAGMCADPIIGADILRTFYISGTFDRHFLIYRRAKRREAAGGNAAGNIFLKKIDSVADATDF
ncbi:hypothetical protein DXA59_13435 [Clostridium sp. OF03-18AA]|nr:hypothetical protein DXA59_13435 [Clostridium sp. OF03-18AA]